jgi:hypothetical protein
MKKKSNNNNNNVHSSIRNIGFYKSSPAFSIPGDKPEITPAVLPTFIQWTKKKGM